MSDVQRLVKQKGYGELRKVINPDADIEDTERLTKKKVIELGSTILLRRLSRGKM